jgi:Tol biopolymer transport system component
VTRGGIVLLAAACTAAVAGCNDFLRHQDIPEYIERIAYTCEHPSTGRDLCIMDPDGANPDALLAALGEEQQPAFSRDGRRIAFTSSRSDSEPGQIYVMYSDGSGLAKVTTAHAPSWPTWSPEGFYLLFASHGLYIITPSGLQETRIVPDSMEVDGSSWSTRGDIVFGSAHGIFHVNSDGSALQTLISGPAHFPRLSPDGFTIAFASADGIDLMHLDGSSRVNILADPAATMPVWSPQGDSIAYVVRGTPDHIWVMSATGTNAHLVPTSGSSATSPDWGVVPHKP